MPQIVNSGARPTEMRQRDIQPQGTERAYSLERRIPTTAARRYIRWPNRNEIPIADAGGLDAYTKFWDASLSDIPAMKQLSCISAEVGERVHDGHHLATELGKAILNAGRILAIVVAKDQSIILHLSQAVGKHLLRDPLKVAFQFAISAHGANETPSVGPMR